MKSKGLGVVVNNKAKAAESVSPYLEALDNHHIEYTLYNTAPEDVDELIQQSAALHDVLFVGGGDGTIRSAAAHLINSPTILGVMPLGTLNHFAKELDLPTDGESLVQALLNRQTITVDTAVVNGRVFINNASIGFYPRFAKKRDYYTRFYNKWLCYLPSFIETFRHHELYELTIKNDELNFTVSTSYLMVSNNLYTFEFPLTIKRTQIDQGLLGIYYFKRGRLDIFKILRCFFNHKDPFESQSTPLSLEVEVMNKQHVSIALDGETMMIETPLHFQSQKKSLTVLAKKSL